VNTLHLKYAVEVEKTRSISQAAENLYMAQPNLSKAIKELEDSLGITIFERSARGVIPTRKGIEFLAYAKDILRQVEKMETLSVPENSERQAFRISIPRGSYIARAFTNFVAELDTQKEIDVSVQETNSMQTIANVAENKHGLGIIRYPADYENYFLDYLREKKLSYEPIWEFDYLAVMSKAHPLANVPDVQYAKLSKFVEITHGDNAVPYLTARMAARAGSSSKAKRKIYVYERCSQFDMLSNIPSTYMWVSPIPEEFLTLYGLVQRKCSSAYHTYKDGLVYEQGYQFTQLDERFLKKLYESRDKVSAKIYT
jgi:DNA-binding transcriptional LysR family regulator